MNRRFIPKTKTYSFLSGFGSTLDIGSTRRMIFVNMLAKNGQELDARKLRSDWATVGKYLHFGQTSINSENRRVIK